MWGAIAAKGPANKEPWGDIGRSGPAHKKPKPVEEDDWAVAQNNSPELGQVATFGGGNDPSAGWNLGGEKKKSKPLFGH